MHDFMKQKDCLYLQNKSSIVHNKVWLKLIYYPESEFYTYRTRAIITHGLYILYSIFEDHFFVFEEVFSENSVLMYGLYSRAAYDGGRSVV